mgnify:CR=1 FL=1
MTRRGPLERLARDADGHPRLQGEPTAERETETPPRRAGRAPRKDARPPRGGDAPAAEEARGVVSLGNLSRIVQSYLPEADLKRIRDAYRLSDDAHLGQFRSSGEPYVSHPIAVAEICAGWRLDADALMAALLHDVMEDTGIAKEQLHHRFGPQVADLVDGLSKLDKVEFATREHAQAESFRKMLLAMARDVRVILIKLADRLHNMRTLGAVDPVKARRIARETLEIYAPIANRLGLHELYRELLDLSFKFRFPYRYAVLRKAVQAARGNRREVVGKILESVQKRLPEGGVKAEVYGREKALYSIYHKMIEKHQSFSQVLDVYGFRVVVDTVPDCYLALGALHSTFKPMPGRFKDYIAIPKVNGYQSLHTTLIGPYGTPVEFQIRTRDMNRIAEAGVAAHWLYKAENTRFSDLQKQTHQWLQSLLDIQRQTGDSLEFLEHVKVDLFPDAVYVFTPRGQIRALPRGATTVDFAYTVHTDVGNQAVAARVNHEPAALRTELQNGDVVEIITDPNSRPNPTWLSFVRTGKARSEIRHFLKTMKYSESVELGRRLYEQALAALRIDPTRIEPALLERALNDAGARSTEQLFADIGLGRTLAPVVARTVSLALGRDGTVLPAPPSPTAPMVIRGTEGMAVQFATCCHAIPGDPIVGHMRGGHGLTLHTGQCDIARRQRTKDPDRWIDVAWAEDVQGSFRSRVDVTTRAGRGVLGKVAAEFAATEANIVNVSMVEDETEEQDALLRFILQVRSRQHLARVMRAIRRLPEVVRIERTSAQARMPTRPGL